MMLKTIEAIRYQWAGEADMQVMMLQQQIAQMRQQIVQAEQRIADLQQLKTLLVGADAPAAAVPRLG